MPLRQTCIMWLRSRFTWKRLAVVAYAVLLTLFLCLFPLYVIFQDPTSPYHPTVVYVIDDLCGGQPANDEAPGIYPQRPERSTWRIAIYNGRCKHRLFFGLGGDHFRSAAMDSQFTHRINTNNAEEAGKLVDQLLSGKPATVEAVEIAILDHGGPGAPRLGPQKIPEQFYQKCCRIPSVTLRFYGCSVGSGSQGERFMKRLADTYSFRVLASRAPVSWNTSGWFGSSVLEVPDRDWVEINPRVTAALIPSPES